MERLFTLARLVSSLLLTVYFIATFTYASQGQEVETGSKAREHWEYLISGWKSEREKLKSYEVIVSGKELRYERLDKNGRLSGLKSNSKVHLRLLCDDLNQTMRSEVQWGEGDLIAGTWLSTANFSALYAKSKIHIVLMIKPADEKPLYAIRLQPAAVGFFGISEFKFFGAANQIDSAYNVFAEKASLYELNKLSAFEYQATLGFEKTSGGQKYYEMCKLIVDEGRGFVVANRRGYPSENPTGPGMAVDTTLDVTWTKRDDLWLPSKLVDVSLPGLSQIELAFDWISVNKALPAKEFEIDSIGAPKGTMIVDQRLGSEKSIIVGYIGGRKAIPNPPPPARTLRTSTIMLLAVGVLMAITAMVSLVVLLWRVRRSSSKQGRTR